MKNAFLIASLFASVGAFAEPKISDIPANEGTTISITKGSTTERDFDILNSTADITGDTNVLLKGARDSWKKACGEWKSEIKELNKENLIAINCNAPKCTTEANQTSCVSNGSYQVKVKIRK